MATKQWKKRQTQLCKSRKIIESFYVKHFTLLHYLHKQSKAIRLIQDGDPVEYRVLMKSTLVAVPRHQSATPPFNPTNTQWFTLKEIINRVIEHVCRSNKTNVLAYGFGSLNGYGTKGTVAGTVGIQNNYPNTIVSYLRTTRAWQVLHQRIGDDLMIHLLQNVSMFVKVNSKCYFQVAGYPISRLSPLSATDVSPQLNKTEHRIQSVGDGDGENAILKRKTRRGGKRARRYSEKSTQQKKDDITELTGKGSEVHLVDVESVQGGDAVATIVISHAVSGKPAQLDRDPNVCPERTQSKRKHKLESDEQQPHAKKAKMATNVDGDASSLFPVETRNVSNVYDDEMTYPKCSVAEKLPTEVSPLLFPDESSENSSEESTHLCGRNSEIFHPHDDVSNLSFREDTETNIVSESNEKAEITAVMPVEKKVETTLKRKKSVSSAGGMRKKEVRRKPWEYLVKFLPKSGQSTPKKPQSEVGCGIQPKGIKAQQRLNKRGRLTSKRERSIRLNEVFLPRSSLFYSSNLSQTFPKNHVMETSPVSMAGARRLTQQIFLQESCLATSRNSGGKMSGEKRDDQTVKNVSIASTNHDVFTTTTPTQKKQKPFRLPKKLKRVQPLLLKFLARHKKCPFRTLLRHHCYYTQKKVKKSKKKRTLQRIPFSVKMMYHKRSWKSGPKSSKRTRCIKRGVKIDVLVYRHAVTNYTKLDQVSIPT